MSVRLDEPLEDRRIGAVAVLIGARGGKYPHGNSLLVQGRQETALIDPSLSVIPRRDRLPRVDRVVNSHCHEDHIAGNHLFPGATWHMHEQDAIGLRSLDDMMAIYGYAEPIHSAFRQIVADDFHFAARADVRRFGDGDVFDLGGARIRVIHTPGHTRGHCCFHCEPDDILYLGDIDLSSFGPYYGDAWSDLESFETTLRQVRTIEARWYATFHHIGVIDGRTAFLERLDRFAAVIQSREQRLVEFLGAPRSLDEIAAHRFVYRPADPVPFAEAVERRSMSQHLDRLLHQGRVREAEPGRFQRA